LSRLGEVAHGGGAGAGVRGCDLLLPCVVGRGRTVEWGVISEPCGDAGL
jgi:hypothetical protein